MLNDNFPIYIQLADRICDAILEGKLAAQDKVPSVRELAVKYEVNNNTAMRGIEMLANDGIISGKRGMGYFVSNNAKELIMERRKKKFFDNYIPNLKKSMRQLDISIKDVIDMLNV